MYSKEQIDELKKLDVIKHFNTVLDSDYKRGTLTATDEKVADIYEAATGTKVSRSFNCKTCVFNLYKMAGKLYRESIEALNKEKMQKVREAKQNKKEKIDNENEGKEN